MIRWTGLAPWEFEHGCVAVRVSGPLVPDEGGVGRGITTRAGGLPNVYFLGAECKLDSELEIQGYLAHKKWYPFLGPP